MSDITKQAIASALKNLASQHSLGKITISQITDECGINRQTFYYHFKNIFDLVEWIYAEEAARAIGENKTYDTWQEGYLQIFSYINENRSFVLGTYHSMNREHLEKFLFEQTYRLLIRVIEEKARGLKVRDDDKSFIANFYKYGFVGLVIEWIEGDMRESPEKITARLESLIHGDIEKALDKYIHL